jgi:DNA-binding beta-propeller fold protein YncE
VDSLPVALAYDGRSVWVANSLGQTLSAVDPASGTVTSSALLPHLPSALLWDGTSLWTANASSTPGTVTQVSRDGEVLADIETGQGPASLAFDGARLWVGNREGRSLARIDTGQARLNGTLPLDGQPVALTFGAGSLWVALDGLNQLVQIDPETSSEVGRVDLDAPVLALWFDGEDVWAAAPDAGEVYRIEPARGEVVQTIAVAGFPVAIHTTSCGSTCRDVWTADQNSDTVTRVRIQ